MKNTKDAIKYGINTLNVKPAELFDIIKQSRDYNGEGRGEDYKYWLCNKIIEIAEKDGVPYSTLLSKSFNITQSIQEDYTDNSIKEEYLNYFKNLIGDCKLFNINIDWLGEIVSDKIDWWKGVDVWGNGFFTQEQLPQSMTDAILSDEKVTLFCKLSTDSIPKNSELVQDAKSRGITVTNEGSAFMYRMCSIVQAFEQYAGTFQFAFVTNSGFLYNEENADIISYFLNTFKYSGCVVNAKDLFVDNYSNNEYAFCVCSPRTVNDGEDDGFLLKEAKLENDEIVLGDEKRYSRSTKSMFQTMYEKYSVLNKDKVIGINLSTMKPADVVMGCKLALGYVNLIDGDIILTSYPVKGCEVYFPIIEKNLELVIALFGIVKSNAQFGIPGNITNIVDGNPDSRVIIANSFPLFLFDVNSRFADCGSISTKSGATIRLGNKFDVISSKLVEDLVARYMADFKFEAKSLIETCMGIMKYFNDDLHDNMEGYTFEALRKDCDNAQLNRDYLKYISNLKDFISTYYRRIK